MKPMTRKAIIWLVSTPVLLSMLGFFFLKPQPAMDIPYSEFLRSITKGEIQKVIIDGQELKGTKTTGERFTSFNPGDPQMIESLMKNHVDFKGDRPERYSFWLKLASPFILMGAMFFLMRRTLGGVLSLGKNKAKLISDDKVKVTFSDVAGCNEAKEDVKELVDLLKDPNKFRRLGGMIPRGVLMMGPPGTGKTLLARAIAGEAKVPFFSISGSDFVEMYVGLGAARVRSMFEEAKKKAPCIIFIDEIDAVGRQRGLGQTGGHDEREQTLNQLLVEMDGFSGNEGIIMIAATNRPDVLDKALLRPGRFDRHITVGLPDVRERKEILAVHMKRIPVGTDVESALLARGTPGFSGADLSNLVNEAALFAARSNKRQVDMEDFETAKDKILMGAERTTAVMSEDDKRVTAYHEAGHALVGRLVPDHDPIYKVSIIPRGRALGITMFLPERDQHNASKEKLESQISSLYGGRLAEEVVFGPQKVTTGAQNDLERATQIARNMVTRWGLSERLGPLFFGEESGDATQNKSVSIDTAQIIDEEIRGIITRNYERANRLIRDNLDNMHLMAEALMKYETLDRFQIDQIMEGHVPSPPKDWVEKPTPLAKSEWDTGSKSLPSYDGRSAVEVMARASNTGTE